MRPHGKYARVNPSNPEAFAICDRCGLNRNRTDLRFQVEWAGQHLYNIQILVCKERCLDVPQEQLRTIILPPDPPSILNARTENYAYEEQTVLIMQFQAPAPWGGGPQLLLCDQSGELPFIMQYLTSR